MNNRLVCPQAPSSFQCYMHGYEGMGCPNYTAELCQVSKFFYSGRNGMDFYSHNFSTARNPILFSVSFTPTLKFPGLVQSPIWGPSSQQSWLTPEWPNRQIRGTCSPLAPLAPRVSAPPLICSGQRKLSSRYAI